MTVKINVYSDYVCPFCFLAEQPLYEAIEGKDDIEVEWMPYELRPYPNETLRPEDSYLQTTWKQSVYPLAKEMGIPIVLPNVSPQPYTHLAFEGYQFAKANDKGNEYNDRMLRAFFQEQQNIGDVDVLTKLAGEIGLDEGAYRAAIENRTYKEAHEKALDHAYNEAEITAVPTFMIGSTKVSGIRSKEALEQIIEQERKKQTKKVTLLMDGQSCGIDGCS
ncbi:DsbA family oxidoreductase [Domibacillus sp. A3M-37]|uniref:DsbA family oxidoreductase n=1 Tax=Domibacillus TaxID=1433999 RepID=UPI0006183572|nr:MULTISPECIES: DsbA family oxidoreductase [Domibacillus]MCP3763366.1 DsbA family oxidoreductase [Domibacillus sp. A3M-37]